MLFLSLCHDLLGYQPAFGSPRIASRENPKTLLFHQYVAGINEQKSKKNNSQISIDFVRSASIACHGEQHRSWRQVILSTADGIEARADKERGVSEEDCAEIELQRIIYSKWLVDGDGEFRCVVIHDLQLLRPEEAEIGPGPVPVPTPVS